MKEPIFDQVGHIFSVYFGLRERIIDPGGQAVGAHKLRKMKPWVHLVGKLAANACSLGILIMSATAIPSLMFFIASTIGLTALMWLLLMVLVGTIRFPLCRCLKTRKEMAENHLMEIDPLARGDIYRNRSLTVGKRVTQSTVASSNTAAKKGRCLKCQPLQRFRVAFVGILLQTSVATAWGKDVSLLVLACFGEAGLVHIWIFGIVGSGMNDSNGLFLRVFICTLLASHMLVWLCYQLLYWGFFSWTDIYLNSKEDHRSVGPGALVIWLRSCIQGSTFGGSLGLMIGMILAPCMGAIIYFSVEADETGGTGYAILVVLFILIPVGIGGLVIYCWFSKGNGTLGKPVRIQMRQWRKPT